MPSECCVRLCFFFFFCVAFSCCRSFIIHFRNLILRPTPILPNKFGQIARNLCFLLPLENFLHTSHGKVFFLLPFCMYKKAKMNTEPFVNKRKFYVVTFFEQHSCKLYFLSLINWTIPFEPAALSLSLLLYMYHRIVHKTKWYISQSFVIHLGLFRSFPLPISRYDFFPVQNFCASMQTKMDPVSRWSRY